MPAVDGDLIGAFPPMTVQPRMHVVLHQPEIPQNTGNIGRTCVAAGAALWLVRPLGFRLDASRLKRAGMDYWRHLQWRVVDDWEQLLRELPQAASGWCFSRSARRRYTEVSYAEGDVLVFGSETQGLPESLLRDPQRSLTIPMQPEARSLNLASSAAIVIYEALRQFPQE